MINWILDKIGKLPNIWQWVLSGALIFVLVMGLFLLTSQVQSCGYNKARQEYQTKEAGLLAERTKLLADAEAKERQIAELGTKVAAYEAAAEAGKKLNADLIDKINEVAKDASKDEANAGVPADCHVRAARVCALLRANNIPGDCNTIERESCK